MEVLKSRIAKRQVTISKESRARAQTRCYYSTEKLLRDFPGLYLSYAAGYRKPYGRLFSCRDRQA